jgi:hypothetical protein
MFPAKRATALASGLALLVACAATTTLTSTWRSPEAQGVNLTGKSVAVVFLTNNESDRRNGENALAWDLFNRGARGFATYRLLPGDEHLDGDIAQARMKAAGADAVVTMRIVGQDQRITYTPGTVVRDPWRTFRPYWNTGWHTVYQPGNLRTETRVSVETLVYSLPDAQNSQLIWASTSRTSNPNEIGTLVRDVSQATVREMTSQGFLAR